MSRTKDAYRRRQSRRSTAAAVGGVGLIAVAVILTLTRLIGDVVPTLLGVLGVALLITGIALGAQLVAENARYHQSQSLYDDD
ncbi:MAG TPA: hypothetical protein VF635_05500 [Propionibacteriaceae bacterium]|jgi:multisubunit Na+/H+ antiporter MnhG subunit